MTVKKCDLQHKVPRLHSPPPPPNPHMALGLRLVAVLPHDFLEGYLETQYLRHDVDTAHDELVKVTLTQQISRTDHRMLKTGPHPSGTEEREEGESESRVE